MSAKTLMVLGSMSSAGKSLTVAGLCRLYARRGWRVAPFKAQNMSNNAAVCSGGEVGRAQASQAYAAGAELSVDMNPILLKPEGDNRSQVVVRGQVWQSFTAMDYYSRHDFLWQSVTASLDALKERYDLVIMEGAGSPAEMNLMKSDMVNLAAARYAGAPCLLVGDIDRGGVFAQLLGTLWLLEESDRALIRGLIVNKFRGDLDLFTDGVRYLEEKGGVPVVGVVPFVYDHGIPEEDAAAIGESLPDREGALDIAVLRLPRVSNIDDLDPLLAEPGVQVRYVHRVDQFSRPDAVILPGSKNTLADLAWLQQTGLGEAIRKAAASGVSVVGLCGGFQMLGEVLTGREGVEAGECEMAGLGLLPARTHFEQQKTVTRTSARLASESGFLSGLEGQLVSGYEIHMGQTVSAVPFARVTTREGQPADALDGACSPDGKVWGTYLHGIFENDHLRSAWLESLGGTASHQPFARRRSQAYDRMADVLEAALDLPYLDHLIEQGL